MIRTQSVVGDGTLSAIVQSFYGDALQFWVSAAASGITDRTVTNVGHVPAIPDLAKDPAVAGTRYRGSRRGSAVTRPAFRRSPQPTVSPTPTT
jgi:hypothetical protein